MERQLCAQWRAFWVARGSLSRDGSVVSSRAVVPRTRARHCLSQPTHQVRFTLLTPAPEVPVDLPQASPLLLATCAQSEFQYPATWLADVSLRKRQLQRFQTLQGVDPPSVKALQQLQKQRQEGLVEPEVAFGPPREQVGMVDELWWLVLACCLSACCMGCAWPSSLGTLHLLVSAMLPVVFAAVAAPGRLHCVNSVRPCSLCSHCSGT